MTDLEKYKQLFDETNVGYDIEFFDNAAKFSSDMNEKNVTIIRIEADYSKLNKTFVNGGYNGFACALIFNENGKLIKFDIFE